MWGSVSATMHSGEPLIAAGRFGPDRQTSMDGERFYHGSLTGDARPTIQRTVPAARPLAKTAKRNRDASGYGHVGAVHGLDVDMWLGRVAGVAALRDLLAGYHGVAVGHSERCSAEMCHRDEGSAVAVFHDHIVASNSA